MNIGPYSYEDYVAEVKSYHGNTAPGVIIGGLMVDCGLKHLPAGGIYDALSETTSCLPDALQLLTPCTTGNGWLRVIDLGRFALALYDKVDGKGTRVFLDCCKVSEWPAIRTWYLRLAPKKEQNLQQLLDEIRAAGSTICGVQTIVMQQHFLEKKLKGAPVVACPACGEGYPANHGQRCRACQGNSPYAVPQSLKPVYPIPESISHTENKSMVLVLENLLKHETSY